MDLTFEPLKPRSRKQDHLLLVLIKTSLGTLFKFAKGIDPNCES